MKTTNNEQVTRQHIDRWGYHSSSVFRGCSSSLNAACELDAELSTAVHQRRHPRLGEGINSHDGRDSNGGASGSPSGGSSRQQPICCTTDLCNGSEDAREGQRRSEEHLRVLMEGNPRRKKGHSSGFSLSSGVAPASGHGLETGTAGAVDGGIAGGEDGNSAKSTRGGSRFATVLVIVGTFSHVLWLVSWLIE